MRWFVRIGRSVPCVVASVFVSMALSGCHTFDRPVSVLVQDAETKVPVPNAQVRLTDQTAHPPHGLIGHTGEDGTARVRLASLPELALAVEATAPGYLSEEKDLPVESLRAISTNPFASFDHNTPTLVIQVFAGPRPTIDLVVPNGYRGVLRAEIKTRDDLPFPPGQRLFAYEVPPTGVVQIVGPPVLLHGLSPDIRAAYVDGTPLKRDAKDQDIGLRWVRADGNDQVFVVGTWLEWNDVKKEMEKEDSQKPKGGGGGHHGGSGGGGRGMGGRGGRMGGGMGGGGGTGGGQ